MVFNVFSFTAGIFVAAIQIWCIRRQGQILKAQREQSRKILDMLVEHKMIKDETSTQP